MNAKKKNIPMRAAGALFIGVMLTSSIVSGSFAKYVTQSSSSDTARVAKFGVVAAVSGDLFGDSYVNVEGGNTVQTWGQNKETVSADVKGTSVVAPGTKSENPMIIHVTGKPEVSTKLTLDNCTDADGKTVVDTDIKLGAGQYGVMVEYKGDFTADTIGSYYVYDAETQKYTAAAETDTDKTLYQLKDTSKVDADYLPLVWKVGDAEKTTVADVKAAVVSEFNAKTFEPNTDLSGQISSQKIAWEWKFEVEKELEGGSKVADAAVDAKDTILGDMIVGANTDYAVVKLNADNESYDAVNYADVAAAAGSANTVKVAYTGNTAPTAANDDSVCAVLTVTFGARLTVTQVD